MVPAEDGRFSISGRLFYVELDCIRNNERGAIKKTLGFEIFPQGLMLVDRQELKQFAYRRTCTISYSVSGVVGVPKRALTAYNVFPNRATVVGTRKASLVIVSTMVPLV